jgi:hypothetical protein
MTYHKPQTKKSNTKIFFRKNKHTKKSKTPKKSKKTKKTKRTNRKKSKSMKKRKQVGRGVGMSRAINILTHTSVDDALTRLEKLEMENAENMEGNHKRAGRNYIDIRNDVLELPYHLAQCKQLNKEEEYKCVLKKLQYLKRLRDLVRSVDDGRDVNINKLTKNIKDQQYAKIKRAEELAKTLDEEVPKNLIPSVDNGKFVDYNDDEYDTSADLTTTDLDEATRLSSESQGLDLSERPTIVTTRPLVPGQFGGKRKKRRGSRKGGNLFFTPKLTLDQANLELNNIIQKWNKNVNNSPEQMLTALIDLHKRTKTLQQCNTDDDAGRSCRMKKNAYSENLKRYLIAPPVSESGIINNNDYYKNADYNLQMKAKDAVDEINTIIKKRESRDP